MARGTRHSEETRREALRMLRQGFSQPEIARALGVGERSVRRWAAAPAPPEPVPAAAAEPDSEIASDAGTATPAPPCRPRPASARGMARQALEQAQALAQRAEDAADQVSAARGVRAALAATSTIAQLDRADRQRGGAGNTWYLTPREIIDAEREIHAFHTQLAETWRGRCVQCGCQLRVIDPGEFEPSAWLLAQARSSPHDPAPEGELPIGDMYDRATTIAETAIAVGNNRAASRAVTDATTAAQLQARRELDTRRVPDGAIAISNDEIDREWAEYGAHLEILAKQPLTCGPCGRDRRIWIACDGVEGVAPRSTPPKHTNEIRYVSVTDAMAHGPQETGA